MKALQWIKTNIMYVLIGIILVCALLLLRLNSKNQDLSRDLKKSQLVSSILSNNLIAANDTVHYWKDKAGNSLSEVKVLTATAEMLKDQYSDINKKYTDLVGKDAKNQEMIAYLNGQITIKDRIIADLNANPGGGGSYILNDSTIAINNGYKYDSLNYYNTSGTVITSIKNNKIVAGKTDLTTIFGINIDLALSRDKKSGMASITTKTGFTPAAVSMSGITQITEELNKKPTWYIGAGIIGGYGASLEKQPTLSPFIGIGVYASPRWATIKIHNR
jgi:hypothetical protein